MNRAQINRKVNQELLREGNLGLWAAFRLSKDKRALRRFVTRRLDSIRQFPTT